MKRGLTHREAARRLMRVPKTAPRDTAIRKTIRQIPRGKVATYAQVAAAAGYPIITNGKNLFPGQNGILHIKAIRDSYSSLADEIIKLADDEAYYGRFAAKP